ncbi:hypothetical protein CGMCC3_g14679 [Colletotrichum fructicola]|nr:uncharacterized protein CGMCC3_g14679 [Colletotrichum fructicola]KAE9569179.1 hypothetical protein CGMCC3_g14679 [Colletotrichum fructicola]KAJ0275070.1 hypothetical protein COL940_009009 [Colletotrichum noveboracense]
MNFKVLLVTAFAAFAAAGPLGVDPTSESGELTARQCCISKVDGQRCCGFCRTNGICK